MAEFTAQRLAAIVRQRPQPRVFVETGTMYGQTTALAARFFPLVHTIELEEQMWIEAQRRYPKLANVVWHWGDSRKILPGLCEELTEPVMFYLDAHWYTRPGVGGKDQLPLWDELALIGQRPYADIVVVDDVHSFGTVEPEPAWASVTAVGLTLALGRIEISKVMGDQFVMWRHGI